MRYGSIDLQDGKIAGCVVRDDGRRQQDELAHAAKIDGSAFPGAVYGG